MDDKFLYQNRLALKAAFVEELYQKINNKENSLITFWDIQKKRSSFWLASILLFVVLAACVQKIMGTNFNAIESNSKVTIYEVNYALEIPPPDSAYEPIPDVFYSDYNIVESNEIPLDEEIKLLPFTFNYPNYLPKEFSLKIKYIPSDNPLTSSFADCLFFMWAKDDIVTYGKTINLSVCPIDYWERTIKVAPGKWENIKLENDNQAILVKGSFPSPPPKPYEYDFENHIRVFWDDDDGARLYWQSEGKLYWLETYSEFVTPEDLVMIAESMIDD